MSYSDFILPPTLNLGLRLNLLFDLVYLLFNSFSLFKDLHHCLIVSAIDPALTRNLLISQQVQLAALVDSHAALAVRQSSSSDSHPQLFPGS